MERQETSLERFSVSHPLCLCFISVPWRNSIPAGHPVGPAAARGSPSGCPLYTGSHSRWFFSCVLLSGAERGFQNPRREHRIWHSRGEAFRGVGRGILSMCRGSFRNGVEGSYLKKIKKHCPSLPMEKNRFNVCWSDKWAGTGGWGSETQALPWQPSLRASCHEQAGSLYSSAGLFRVHQ